MSDGFSCFRVILQARDAMTAIPFHGGLGVSAEEPQEANEESANILQARLFHTESELH